MSNKRKQTETGEREKLVDLHNYKNNDSVITPIHLQSIKSIPSQNANSVGAGGDRSSIKQTLENVDNPPPLPSQNIAGKKRVLHGLSGFAKPGQMMAIMGASGSGKTSLLNVLGQRLGLSPGSTMNGQVRCNNRKLGKNDFGKFGAFVQQDDVLLETFTPEESFIFAAKLRTSLSK